MITAVLPLWSEKSPSVASYYRYSSCGNMFTGITVPREVDCEVAGVVLMFVRCQIITRLRQDVLLSHAE